MLAVVADGLGGHNKGEFASNMLINKFEEVYDELELLQNVTPQMEELMRNASAEILQKGRTDSAYQKSGSTCTALFLEPDAFWLAHVGDTRCYRFREGELEQLTTDHTVVNLLVAKKMITASEARTHSRRHMLTDAVGQNINRFKVDTQGPKPVREDDIFLLTSDGIHDSLTESEIIKVLTTYNIIEEIAPLLCSAAYTAGSTDNLSAIAVSLHI